MELCPEYFLMNNLYEVLEYVNNIIMTEDESLATKTLALSIAKSWSKYSKKTFRPHKKFVSNLLSFCSFKEELCVSALDCIEALLSANNNATKLKCMMTKVQFDFIKSRDKEFLSEVIIKLHETMEDFDTDTKEAKAFNKLVATLCSQYEIIMIDES